MAKKHRTTIYIDEELLQLARSLGINLSRFVERVLREEISRRQTNNDNSIVGVARELLTILPEPRLIPRGVIAEYAERAQVGADALYMVLRTLAKPKPRDYDKFVHAIIMILSDLIHESNTHLNWDAMARDLYGEREDRLDLLAKLYDLVKRHLAEFRRVAHY